MRFELINSTPATVVAAPSGGDVKLYDITLAGAGRVSFWQDYSELTGTGTHTFYVERHTGSSGAVAVDYAVTSVIGDAIAGETDTLSWLDGEVGIKSFTQTISTKTTDGLHVVVATLSNPTNSLTLHNGTNTVAYGVIDDGTVPADASAVFYDSAAAGGGTGTAASPYNNIYTAIADMSDTKRYLCGKGTTSADATNLAGDMDGTVHCLKMPTTAASESDRLFIMAWPGNTWTFNSSGTQQISWYAQNNQSYITFRDLDFSGINNTTSSNATAIFCRYGSTGSERINIEYCTADDLNGKAGYNHSAWALWGVLSAKVWRCTANNIQNAGDNTNYNTAGMQSYVGANISMQRCEVTNAHHGMYQKSTNSGDVTATVKFNEFIGLIAGASYETAGGGGFSHSYGLVQHNLFKNCTDWGVGHLPGTGGEGTKVLTINNNVFDNCGGSERGAIHTERGTDMIEYNNIFSACNKVWTDFLSTAYTPVEYSDYSNNYNADAGYQFEHQATNYTAATDVDTALGFCTNYISTDPSFTNTATNDYTRTGTPTDGVDSTEMGIYLTDNEVLGA